MTEIAGLPADIRKIGRFSNHQPFEIAVSFLKVNGAFPNSKSGRDL